MRACAARRARRAMTERGVVSCHVPRDINEPTHRRFDFIPCPCASRIIREQITVLQLLIPGGGVASRRPVGLCCSHGSRADEGGKMGKHDSEDVAGKRER